MFNLVSFQIFLNVKWSAAAASAFILAHVSARNALPDGLDGVLDLLWVLLVLVIAHVRIYIE